MRNYYNFAEKINRQEEQTDGQTQGGGPGKFSKFLSSQGFGIAAGAISSMGSAIQNSGKHQLDPTSAALKQAGNQALGMIPPPIGTALQAASGITSAIAGLTGKTLDGVSTGDKIVSSIPIVGDLMSMFSSSLPKFSYDADKIASDFSTSKLDEAANLSGKNVLFGSGKFKQKLYDAKLKRDIMGNITKENKRRLENDMGSQYNDINNLRFSGQDQTLSLSAKHGIKFPELDAARSILSLQSTKKIKEFKEGGVIEKENFIPKGRLHKELHHIKENNPELEGKITNKGIPVVTMSEGGEVNEAVAEVEREELILSKSNTSTIEDYYKQYQDTNDENILVEAGKWLVDQLLKNTNDQTGLIKSIK